MDILIEQSTFAAIYRPAWIIASPILGVLATALIWKVTQKHLPFRSIVKQAIRKRKDFAAGSIGMTVLIGIIGVIPAAVVNVNGSYWYDNDTATNSIISEVTEQYGVTFTQEQADALITTNPEGIERHDTVQVTGSVVVDGVLYSLAWSGTEWVLLSEV